MNALIQLLLSIFGGGVGQKIGGAVANVTALAALAPVVYWLIENKEGVFLELTYGEVAFFGGLLFFVVKLVHYTRPGGRYHEPGDWPGGA